MLKFSAMVSANVNRILQEVRELSEQEQQELKRLLEQRSPQLTNTKREQLRQQLLSQGIISHIARGAKDAERFRRWHPVAIKGKPLSETIIEERR
jgi:uncharacterized protein YaaW (UPF0174 family)